MDGSSGPGGSTTSCATNCTVWRGVVYLNPSSCWSDLHGVARFYFSFSVVCSPQHKGLFWDISYCGVIASPHTVAMASDNLEDVLSKSGVDSNLTNSLMMEGWTSQTFRMAAADSQGFEDVLHEWSSWHPLTPCRPFRRPACARLLSRFNLSREQVLRFYQLRQ